MPLAHEADEEMPLIDASDMQDSGRQRMSRLSIGVLITVLVLGVADVFAARAGGSLLGTKSQHFQGKASLGSWQGQSAIDDLLDSSKATTRGTEHGGMSAGLGDLLGVLETQSQKHAAGSMGEPNIEHTHALATTGALAVTGTGAKIGGESSPQAALASVTMEDGKVTDKHTVVGQEALKELAGLNMTLSAGLLGALDAAEGKEGSLGDKVANPLASMGAMMAAMAVAEKDAMNHTHDNLLAVADAMIRDMEHAESGYKNDTNNSLAAMDEMMEAITAAEKDAMNHTHDNLLAVADAMIPVIRDMEHAESGYKKDSDNSLAAMDEMMEAITAAEKDVMNHTDDNLLAVADSMIREMEHAQSGNQNGTDNPLAAMDDMMGAMADMESGEKGDPDKSPFAALDAMIGSLQDGETGEKGHADGNPFAGLDALAGTMGAGEAGSRPVENKSPFAIVDTLAEPMGQMEQDRTSLNTGRTGDF